MILKCKKCNSVNVTMTEAKPPHGNGARCNECQAFWWLPKADKYGSSDNKSEIWTKTRGRCAYCGIDINPFEKNGYDIDHIEPQVNGGTHGVDNLYLACIKCNRVKKDKSLEDFRSIMQSRNMLLSDYTFYFELDMVKVAEVEKIIETELEGLIGKK